LLTTSPGEPSGPADARSFRSLGRREETLDVFAFFQSTNESASVRVR
jgi:hypothetical protein